MKLKELTDCLSVYFLLVIRDDFGIMYFGDFLHLPTIWDDREVAWIRPGPHKGLLIELI